MAGINDERPVVATEDQIVRIAKSIEASTSGLWDFGQEYAILNRDKNFNYRALARAVKDQHGVDLYPPSVASKLRKAYEKYAVECKVPMETLKQFSPYTLYELSVVTDVDKKNVGKWLQEVSTTPRADLLARITGGPEGNGKPESPVMIRVPENIKERLDEAQLHLQSSVKVNISTTVLLEFVTELVLDTAGPQLRRLWLAVHGELEEA